MIFEFLKPNGSHILIAPLLRHLQHKWREALPVYRVQGRVVGRLAPGCPQEEQSHHRHRHGLVFFRSNVLNFLLLGSHHNRNRNVMAAEGCIGACCKGHFFCVSWSIPYHVVHLILLINSRIEVKTYGSNTYS